MSAAPKVKICGVTNLDDARLAVTEGAWAIGMIFHEPSPRACARDDAAEIGAALHRSAELCGVFVNAHLDEIARIADEARLTLVQLHGDEGPAFCGEVARRTGARVMKAMQVRSRADVQALKAFHTDFHLLDGHSRDLRGGTGQTFDWSLIAGLASKVPLVLSGGLQPGNVGDGIEATQPWAVDVASGVEAVPGRKDPGKLHAFFEAVRAATPAQESVIS